MPVARHQLYVRLCLLPCVWLSHESQADEWSGRDKASHFVATAALSAVLTASSKRPAVGFWTGVAAGAAKEVWDKRHPDHQASGKDFVWSVAGAYVGTQGGRWLLKRSEGQTILAYAWTF